MSTPNVIIGGERRSGTTALAKWLANHSDIYILPQYELSYFCDSEIVGTKIWRDGKVDPDIWDKTHNINEYLTFFQNGGEYEVRGEKSADYLFWKPAHKRIAEYLPDAKFVFILRDPVERAWSQYINEVCKGRETLSFDQALALENERCQKSDYALYHLAYRRRSFYDESLEHFLQYIPSRRVLVITLEKAIQEPIATLQEVYHFLELSPLVGLEEAGKRHNSKRALMPRASVMRLNLTKVALNYSKQVKRLSKRLTKDTIQQRKIIETLETLFYCSTKHVKLPLNTRRLLIDEMSPHVHNLRRILQQEFPEWNADGRYNQ